MAGPESYELLDCGNGRRLDRFGARITDRPAPAAFAPPRLSSAEWQAADLVFDRERGWTGRRLDAWQIEVGGLTVELRPTDSGQTGLYPEHLTFWPWLRDALAARERTSVLNLFAASGATTLALAGAGADVTHVDAARGAVAWARRNAELSGLADRPIRWIVDDALAFTRREARRGRSYDGFVLDPPSYGHGRGGARWTLEDMLPDLLDAVRIVATDDAFVLLTAHTGGLEPDDLGRAVRDAFGARSHIATDWTDLEASSGASLRLGAAARMIRR